MFSSSEQGEMSSQEFREHFQMIITNDLKLMSESSCQKHISFHYDISLLIFQTVSTTINQSLFLYCYESYDNYVMIR